MSKRIVWRCITVHFGDDVIDAAIARPYRKGLYAIGEHFGTFLADKQHNAPDWPVWWVEAERTPEHDAIAKLAGVDPNGLASVDTTDGKVEP